MLTPTQLLHRASQLCREHHFNFLGSITPTLIAVMLLAACGQPSHPVRVAGLPRYIAHAMGAIDGTPYTNSLEAWQRHHEKGCRHFEVDLMITADGKLIAVHRGFTEALGLGQSPTHSEFMNQKLLGRYTPLDANGLAVLLVQHPGWTIITDFKGDLALGILRLCNTIRAHGLICEDRVIPQAYAVPTDLKILGLAGFKKVILALYGAHLSKEETVRVVREYEQIVAVTVPKEDYDQGLVAALADLGVATYVHTVNDSMKIKELLATGAHGIMTDDRCGS